MRGGVKFLCLLTLTGISAQPPRRPAFEVTSIRPTDGLGDATFLSGIKIAGSAVVMRHIEMGTLLRAAFGVQSRFLSRPVWVEKDPFFDIRATMPAGSSPRQVPEMIQTMLETRFGLAFHMTTERRQVYGLVVGKNGPKLRKSSALDGSLPGGVFTGINTVSDEGALRAWRSPDGSSMRITALPDGGARWEFTGVSLAEFACILNTTDGLDVVDMTGIAGKYDLIFTITREEACELCTSAPGGRPSSTLTLRESLDRMGLKIEKREATVDVFTIDHLDKEPSRN